MYFGSFVPNVAALLHPQSSILSSKQEFVWAAAQENAFGKWKKRVSLRPALVVYSKERLTKVAADAPSYGLSAVWRRKKQNGPFVLVDCVSRVLTEIERRYAQMGKRNLALV